MVKNKSPLTDIMKKGKFGATNTNERLIFSETTFNSVVQVVAYKSTEKDLAELIKKLFKVSLPDVGKFIVISGGYLQWVGAYRYQIVSAKKNLVKRLQKEIDINVASVVELSDARAIFNIKGRKVCDLLSKGASVDFHNSFSTGDIVLTNMAHIGVMVNNIKTKSDLVEVDLYVYRTFAKSFYDFLSLSAQEWGYEVK